MAIRGKEDGPVLGELLEDDLRRRRSDDDIRKRLHRRRAVDVGNGNGVGVLGPPGGKLLGRAGLLQGAAGFQIRDQYFRFGVQDLGGFRHKANPAKNDGFGLGLLGKAGQLQGIPHEVRQVLDFRLLVVMGQKQGPPFFGQPADFLGKLLGLGEHRCADHGPPSRGVYPRFAPLTSASTASRSRGSQEGVRHWAPSSVMR